MSTVWPRCRSGAVGSKPAFTRSGVLVWRAFSSRSRSSASRMISAAPFLMYSSCSSTGAKVMIDYCTAELPNLLASGGLNQFRSSAVPQLFPPHCPRRVLNKAPATQRPASTQHEVDRLGVGDVLLLKDAITERVFVVTVEHLHRTL